MKSSITLLLFASLVNAGCDGSAQQKSVAEVAEESRNAEALDAANKKLTAILDVPRSVRPLQAAIEKNGLNATFIETWDEKPLRAEWNLNHFPTESKPCTLVATIPLSIGQQNFPSACLKCWFTLSPEPILYSIDDHINVLKLIDEATETGNSKTENSLWICKARWLDDVDHGILELAFYPSSPDR